MQKKETAIEVKVGMLVLLGLVLLAVFVFIIGDCNLGGKGARLYADFESAAGVKPGAPVRLSGIQIGSVRRVQYMGGEYDESLGRPVYVRTTLDINEDYMDNIHEESRFTITTQGVLGEPYIEIHSVVSDAPALEPESIVRGEDPPTLASMLESASGALDGIETLVARLNEQEGAGTAIQIDEFINNIGALAGNLNERIENNADEIDSIFEDVAGILDENRDKIPRILDNVEGAVGEFEQVGASLNYGLGRGQSLRSILDNVDTVTESAAREIDPILLSARSTLEQTSDILEENREDIRTTVSNLAETTDDVSEVTGRLERGEGTVGRLLRDEEIFEDMREFIRELKRRPWRIIWKE